ncbi:FAD-dependent oxidoreductase [Rhodospirillaceae bacterium KN72]|uniref:FAD-dependent oxidoreductase n=1 Tax=Pacificispira spongiicola TaxID=2729598 RepID=A0A7Y0HG15_9PROT|nr:FAD-dependent oxidoreductase [Pacificispira spongiicola]NMM46416.1 FAD-dependent oxidoreductase [Pacificispira spongiicola]
MQSHAKVVVVGGGCVGASILFGLTEHGCSDAILIERSQLTAGSTWHAAGLLVTFVRSNVISQMTMETIRIYGEVEKRLGSSCGLRQVGQLRVANTQKRWDEFQSYIGIAEAAGVPAVLLTPEEVQEKHPYLSPSDTIFGGIFHPEDGYINPADITQGLARLARDKGAKIYQNTEARAYEQLSDGGWKVITSEGEITCEHLVFATGNYARENAKRVGLDLPCIPIVHQYWTTEVIPDLKERKAAGLPEFPILRDEDYGAYLREDVGAFQFGPYEFEKDLKLFAVDGVPKDFGADLLPEDFDAVEGQWERAIERVPALGEVGIKANTRGPFQMTPDELPLCGPAPGRDGLWLAEGVPGGILWGGTMGERLSRWILNGDPGIDMSALDPRRFGNYVTKRWTADKVRETWGNHMHARVPGEVYPGARPQKTVGSYDLLTARGAVWTVLNGYELPSWYAPSPELAVPEFSYRKTEHMKYVEAEVRTTRNAAGLIEMSPMTKFRVRGPGAADWLDGIMANKLPSVGRIGLSVACNGNGGIDAEYTIVRYADNDFYLVSTPSGEVYNFDRLSRILPKDGSVTLENISDQLGVIAIAGPKSRDILQPLTDNDLSNEAFPWLSAQRGEVGYARDVHLLRVSYTGELGWELHHPVAYNRHLVDTLLKAGAAHGLVPVGLKALDSMRLEKSYRAIHTELAQDITPLEAGLDRFVRLDKGEFTGRSALVAQKKAGLRRVLVTLTLPAADTSVVADEGVYRDGTLVGRVTSGGYSYHFGHDIAMALVSPEAAVEGTKLHVLIHNEMRAATVVHDSLYDRASEKARL